MPVGVYGCWIQSQEQKLGAQRRVSSHEPTELEQKDGMPVPGKWLGRWLHQRCGWKGIVWVSGVGVERMALQTG